VSREHPLSFLGATPKNRKKYVKNPFIFYKIKKGVFFWMLDKIIFIKLIFNYELTIFAANNIKLT
jgi:hypothetical protein